MLCAAIGASSTACVRSERLQSKAPNAKTEEPDAARWLAEARRLARAGDGTRAEQYLNAARDKGASDRQVFPLLLEVCVRDNRYQSAATYAEYFLRKHPNDYHMRYVLATLYIGLEDVERARAEFERLLKAKPQHAPAHYAFAVLLRDNLHDLSAADHHFREYLRIDPRGQHSQEASSSLLNQVP
jgi:tetratricopeptide (TPR) repeat protein